MAAGPAGSRSGSPKVLIVSFYFPPAGGGGVQRPLKFATHLPSLGVETHVLAPIDPKWIHRDEGLALPEDAAVHRAVYVGPRGRLPAEELYGLTGADRMLRRAFLTPRRLLVPDENVLWAATAIPAAVRIVRARGIDVILTTSPPSSIHLIGAAVQRLTGVKWVADLRDSLVAKPDRRFERALVRVKELGHRGIARIVARSADATVAVTERIAAEMTALGPRGPVSVIPNGSDFEDFDGLEHHPSSRFRITHTGTFFGTRDARAFLSALADSEPDVVARFVGDFRRADRDWALGLGLGERLELHPYLPRREALAMQRDSEALLLLLPDAGGRGVSVPSGKIFEYLASGRPILAAVPPEGAAADLVRATESGVVVPSGDADALREALGELRRRWLAGTLDTATLSSADQDRLSRRTRTAELAELLRGVACG